MSEYPHKGNQYDGRHVDRVTWSNVTWTDIRTIEVSNMSRDVSRDGASLMADQSSLASLHKQEGHIPDILGIPD